MTGNQYIVSSNTRIFLFLEGKPCLISLILNTKLEKHDLNSITELNPGKDVSTNLNRISKLVMSSKTQSKTMTLVNSFILILTVNNLRHQ